MPTFTTSFTWSLTVTTTTLSTTFSVVFFGRIVVPAGRVSYIAGTFGLGIILIVCAVLTAIFLLWRKRVTLFKYWYRWLGIIAATFGVWGIMAFYDAGGTVGRAIIQWKDTWGGFRIALLFLFGIALIFLPAVLFLTRLRPKWPAHPPQGHDIEEKKKKAEREGGKRAGGKNWDEKWRRDPVNVISWLAIVIWAGLGLLAEITHWGPDTFYWWSTWAVIMAGAGAILILAAFARLLMPEHRHPIIGNLVMGFVFLSVGLVPFWGLFRIGAIIFILGGALFVTWVIAARPKHIKDTGVSTSKLENTRRQEQAQPFREEVSDREAHTQANARAESRLRMHCRNCGKELVGVPDFCKYCGTKPTAGDRFCPYCGAATYQSAVFCTKCGIGLLDA